jgi:hypothetical protein
MAPKKGMKRTQEMTSDAPAEKKPKTDSKFKPIIEGIDQACALNDSCRHMLLAAIPGSLDTPSDLRHETQHAFVKMIGQALEEVLARMQQALDDQRTKLEEFESSKSTLIGKVTEGKDALAEADNTQQSKKSALADKAQALKDAKTALEEKKEAQRTGDIAVDEASKLKSALDQVLDIDLKAIVEGEFASADAGTHYKSLEPFFVDLILDDSLKTALPITCVKPKADRGHFDIMVISELQKCFSKKQAELSQMLAEAIPRKAERDAAVEAAETHVKDAQDLQDTAAEELVSAKGLWRQAFKTVKLAEAEVAAYEPERLKVEGEKDAKAAILDNFKQYNLGCFELLRDRTSKPIVEQQAHVGTPGEHEKVETNLISPSKLDAVLEETKADTPTAVGGA